MKNFKVLICLLGCIDVIVAPSKKNMHHSEVYSAEANNGSANLKQQRVDQVNSVLQNQELTQRAVTDFKAALADPTNTQTVAEFESYFYQEMRLGTNPALDEAISSTSNIEQLTRLYHNVSINARQYLKQLSNALQNSSTNSFQHTQQITSFNGLLFSPNSAVESEFFNKRLLKGMKVGENKKLDELVSQTETQKLLVIYYKVDQNSKDYILSVVPTLAGSIQNHHKQQVVAFNAALANPTSDLAKIFRELLFPEMHAGVNTDLDKAVSEADSDQIINLYNKVNLNAGRYLESISLAIQQYRKERKIISNLQSLLWEYKHSNLQRFSEEVKHFNEYFEQEIELGCYPNLDKQVRDLNIEQLKTLYNAVNDYAKKYLTAVSPTLANSNQIHSHTSPDTLNGSAQTFAENNITVVFREADKKTQQEELPTNPTLKAKTSHMNDDSTSDTDSVVGSVIKQI